MKYDICFVPRITGFASNFLFFSFFLYMTVHFILADQFCFVFRSHLGRGAVQLCFPLFTSWSFKFEYQSFLIKDEHINPTASNSVILLE